MANIPNGYVECPESEAAHLTFAKLKGKVLPIRCTSPGSLPYVEVPTSEPNTTEKVALWKLKLFTDITFLKKAEPVSMTFDATLIGAPMGLKGNADIAFANVASNCPADQGLLRFAGKRVRVTITTIDEAEGVGS